MQAQQHRPSQPGFQMEPQSVQDFNNQLYHQQQQQISQEQAMRQGIAPPEQAIQHLNDHIRSFYETYGQFVPQPQQSMPMQQPMQQPMPQPMPQPIIGLPHSSAAQFIVAPRPCTPPNAYMVAQPMSSIQGRAERALLDVAPMPTSYANVPLVQIQEPMQAQDTVSVFHESFGGSDYGYSSYQSSLVDPSSPTRSPVRQGSSHGMPTLYEDVSPASSQGPFGQEHLLLAAASSTPDLRYYEDSPMRMPSSPREQMLRNLEIDASIEDTGISAEEVQQYISEQDDNDSKWTCLFPECGKKFGRKENIRSHVQTHLGDRQFKCNFCQKCFVRQHDLKRHAKIHSGDKPHKCPCGNGFARQDALTRHRQRGVCEGALPGFEKREVKRGRPRKTRPDMVDRVEKATRARRMDSRRGSHATYASSSDSEHSYPDTPPNANEYDDDTFADFANADTNFNAFMKQYQDTPPTSPVTGGTSPTKAEQYTTPGATFEYDGEPAEVSPAALSAHSSSPPALSHSPVAGAQYQNDGFASTVFDFGAIDAQPNVCGPVDAFSPANTSSSGSELDHFSPGANIGADNAFMGSEGLLDFNNSMYGTSDALFAASLDAWLENQ
ncbi:hypothetical protein MBLNU459_g1760t1 [Dothideomycetes sp. NU459]